MLVRKPYWIIMSVLCLGFSQVALGQKESKSLRIHQNLHFKTDKYQLNESQKAMTHSFFAVLDSTKKYNVRVLGYADYRGTDAYNYTLSQNRAKTVEQFIREEFSERIHRIESFGRGELPQKANIPLRKNRVVIIQVFEYEEKTLEDLKRGNIAPMDEFVIENLMFKPGQHFLILESVPVLKQLEKALKKHTKIYAEIAGHVCCGLSPDMDGFDIDTQSDDLSHQRAKNIYEYLLRSGIDSTRLIHNGYGFSQPKNFPEITEEDKDQNRRVEIRILSAD